MLAELGVTVNVTRTSQVLSWELPLPGGTEGDMVFEVDLTGLQDEPAGCRATDMPGPSRGWRT